MIKMKRKFMKPRSFFEVMTAAFLVHLTKLLLGLENLLSYGEARRYIPDLIQYTL